MGKNRNSTPPARHFCQFYLPGILMLVLLSTISCGIDLPTVDMRDISSERVEIGQQQQILHVAIGAMISPEKTRKFYNELMTLIAKRLGMIIQFSQRRTYAEINEMIKNKEIDFAYICSGPYTKGKDEGILELLAVPVVNGQMEYRSYFITHKESNINSFDELKGKKFVFTDPNSNTGYLVPVYKLAKLGETAQSFFKETFFSYSHDNSIQAVAEKQADGAAVDSLIWEFLVSENSPFALHCKIIFKSEPFGMPPFVVPTTLDKNLKSRLKEILLSLHNDEDAVLLLRKVHIDRFAEYEDSRYETVREMEQWIKKQHLE